jgi:hypothetical protein
VIRARTTEGDSGDVTLTIVNKSAPQKSAQVIKFKIRPLSLHNRVHDDDEASQQQLQYSEVCDSACTPVYCVIVLHELESVAVVEHVQIWH